MNRSNRIQYLQERLTEAELGGALIGYSRDIFYYTGTAQPAWLAVFPDDYRLYIRSGYDFAVGEVFIDTSKIRRERKLEAVYREMFTDISPKRVGLELDVLTAKLYLQLKKIFEEFEIAGLTPIVLEQRKTKDIYEIEQVRVACEAVHAGHDAVLDNLVPGVTELELSAAIENAHRLAGHEGAFFFRMPDFFMSRGPMGSGPNLFRLSGVVYSITGVGLSPAVPVGPSRRKIRNGDLVLVDIPTCVNGYHADQTRTYVAGKADEDKKNMFAALKEIADYLVDSIRPGMICRNIYQMAMEKAEALGVADAFENFGNGKPSRLIGHGVGLEVNEPPMISSYDNSPVGENHVMALELHMLREGVGVMKLEDTILIGASSNEILTKSPRELVEVM